MQQRLEEKHFHDYWVNPAAGDPEKKVGARRADLKTGDAAGWRGRRHDYDAAFGTRWTAIILARFKYGDRETYAASNKRTR